MAAIMSPTIPGKECLNMLHTRKLKWGGISPTIFSLFRVYETRNGCNVAIASFKHRPSENFPIPLLLSVRTASGESINQSARVFVFIWSLLRYCEIWYIRFTIIIL